MASTRLGSDTCGIDHGSQPLAAWRALRVAAVTPSEVALPVRLAARSQSGKRRVFVNVCEVRDADGACCLSGARADDSLGCSTSAGTCPFRRTRDAEPR
jgi:hypothetical protein